MAAYDNESAYDNERALAATDPLSSGLAAGGRRAF